MHKAQFPRSALVLTGAAMIWLGVRTLTHGGTLPVLPLVILCGTAAAAAVMRDKGASPLRAAAIGIAAALILRLIIGALALPAAAAGTLMIFAGMRLISSAPHQTPYSNTRK